MILYTNEFINLTAEGAVLFITFLVNLTIAGVVFLNNPKKKINVVFSILIGFVALWNLTNFFSNSSVQYNMAYFWTQLALGAVIFIPGIFLYFSKIFPKQKKMLTLNLIIIFLPGLIMFPFVFSKYNVSHLSREPWGSNFVPGVLYKYYIIYFFLYISWGLLNLIIKYNKNDNKIVKSQIRYIIFGVGVTALAGIITNAILPLFGVAKYNIYGTPLSIIFGLFTAYAITRYRFMDIKVVLRKSFVYGIGIFVLFGLVVGGGVVIEKVLVNYLNFSEAVGIMLGVAFIVIVFPSLKNYIKNKLDQVFKKDYIDLAKKFEEFKDQGFTNNSRIENFCQELSIEIKHTLKLSSLYFFVSSSEDNKFERFFPKNQDEIIKKDAQLISILDKTKGIVIKEELSYFKDGQVERRNGVSELEEKEVGQLIKLMNKKKLEFIIPLKFSGEVIGFLSGGAKDDAESFSSKDIEFFEYVQERTRVVLGQLRQRNNFFK